jgi:hypothetical protein
MIESSLTYQVQYSHSRDAVWIHACDGSTVGRFGKMGVDLHNSITEQLGGAPQCRLCTHGRVTTEDWQMFRDKAAEWWGVDVPADAFNQQYLSSHV